MKRIVIALSCFSLTFAGCSSAPFTPGKPVTIEGGALSREYRQDGVRIDQQNMLEHLRSDPASADKASAARTWQLVSIVPASAGGFLIGYYAVASGVDSDTQTTGLLIGAGLFLLGVGAAVHADGLLSDAAGLYNNSLSSAKPRKAGSLLTPSLQPALLYSGAGKEILPGLVTRWRLP